MRKAANGRGDAPNPGKRGQGLTKAQREYHYNVADWRTVADFGAASTHGGTYCLDCRFVSADKRRCAHPNIHVDMSLGTHPERMGCRNGWEPRRDGD